MMLAACTGAAPGNQDLAGGINAPSQAGVSSVESAGTGAGGHSGSVASAPGGAGGAPVSGSASGASNASGVPSTGGTSPSGVGGVPSTAGTSAFGSDITWGGKGEGNGPWIAADLENGVFKSNQGGWQSQSLMVPSAKTVSANFATAMLKGPSGNHFTLEGGNAQSGALVTMWDGVRPSSGYSPKKLQGALILGTGGDGSNGGTGTFFEGAMTSGTPPDAVDDAVQANIVAAGYGK